MGKDWHDTCRWRLAPSPAPLPSDGREEPRSTVSRITLEPGRQLVKAGPTPSNPKTIVVLVKQAFPTPSTGRQEHVPAILSISPTPQRGAKATAIAKVLFGDYNPAAISSPRPGPNSSTELPPMMDYNIRDGRTYMYFKAEAALRLRIRPQLHDLHLQTTCKPQQGCSSATARPSPSRPP